ncbi:MAG: diacylglycerol kinase family protein [Cyclobacteriaceae bacterium]
MKKVLCLINPISGGLDKSSFKSQVKKFCERENYELHFIETTGENDDQLLAQNLTSEKPDLLLICGGDGTVNLAATCLQHLEQNVLTGIIPLGSANGMAEDLNIPEDINRALNLLTRGKEKSIDVLQVNDQYSIHLSDLGFNAKLIRKFEMSGNRGKWNYARHFFRVLREQAVSEYSVLMNGELHSFKAQMVAIANARRYGTGAVINPKGHPDDGKFEICIFKPYPWYAFFGITWRFFTGDISSSPYVKIISTKEALIMVNPDEILQVDGEVIGPTSKVEVSISSKPMRVIAG